MMRTCDVFHIYDIDGKAIEVVRRLENSPVANAAGLTIAKPSFGNSLITEATQGLPEFPSKGFADLMAARTWAADFVHWYNHEHRHSGIRYVSPAQRHAGQDEKILAARHELYANARESNPRRWTRHTRNWSPIGTVTLNPEREIAVPTRIKPGAENQRLAA